MGRPAAAGAGPPRVAVEQRAVEGIDRAWGYEFDVQTRWSFYPARTPNIIVTTFVANAFLDWYERDGDGRIWRSPAAAAVPA